VYRFRSTRLLPIYEICKRLLRATIANCSLASHFSAFNALLVRGLAPVINGIPGILTKVHKTVQNVQIEEQCRWNYSNFDTRKQKLDRRQHSFYGDLKLGCRSRPTPRYDHTKLARLSSVILDYVFTCICDRSKSREVSNKSLTTFST